MNFSHVAATGGLSGASVALQAGEVVGGKTWGTTVARGVVGFLKKVKTQLTGANLFFTIAKVSAAVLVGLGVVAVLGGITCVAPWFGALIIGIGVALFVSTIIGQVDCRRNQKLVGELHGTVERAQGQVAVAIAENEALKGQLSKCLEHEKELGAVVQSLRAKIEEGKGEVARLQQAAEEQGKKIGASEDLLKGLRGELEAVRASAQRVQQANEASGAHIKELEGKVGALEERLHAQVLSFEESQAKLAALQGSLSGLKAECETKQRACEELKREIAQKGAQKGCDPEEIQRLERKLEAQKAEVLKAQAEIKGRDEQLQILKEEHANRDQVVDQLLSQLDAGTKQAVQGHMAKVSKTAEAVIAGQRKIIEALEAQKKELEKSGEEEAKALLHAIDNVGKLEALSLTIQALNKQIKAGGGNVSENMIALQEKVREAEADLLALRAVLLSATAKAEEQGSTLNKLRGTLGIASEKSGSLMNAFLLGSSRSYWRAVIEGTVVGGVGLGAAAIFGPFAAISAGAVVGAAVGVPLVSRLVTWLKSKPEVPGASEPQEEEEDGGGWLFRALWPMPEEDEL